MRQGVELAGVSETLLIPLCARAIARKDHPELGFSDPLAERLAKELGAPLERFAGDAISMRSCLTRAVFLDRVARDFLARHQGALVVSLGAGLCTRFQRVDEGKVRWVELDLPPVAELKRKLVPETERYRILAGSATDAEWLSRLDRASGQPTLVIAEGLLMYLPPAEVYALLRRLVALGEGTELAFDYYSPLVTRTSKHHPSVGKTEARYQWGVWTARAIEAEVPGLRIVEKVDGLKDAPLKVRLPSRVHRALLGGSGLMTVARAVATPASQ